MSKCTTKMSVGSFVLTCSLDVGHTLRHTSFYENGSILATWPDESELWKHFPNPSKIEPAPRPEPQCLAWYPVPGGIKRVCQKTGNHDGPHVDVDGREFFIGGPTDYRPSKNTDSINHPAHYGGAENVYEVIKVIEAWSLGFGLGNAVKYIARAGRKDPTKIVEDLKKAKFYLDREIQMLEDALQK